MRRTHDDDELRASEELKRHCAEVLPPRAPNPECDAVHSEWLRERVALMRAHGRALAERYDAEDEHFRAVFEDALASALEVDPYIVAQVANLDFLRCPNGRVDDIDDVALNCAQLLTHGSKGPDSIEAVLSFLCEPCGRDEEPYEHSAAMQATIRATLRHILDTYGTADKYFSAVSRTLWRHEKYMVEAMGSYVAPLQMRLCALNEGRPCVFDHWDEETDVAVYV